MGAWLAIGLLVTATPEASTTPSPAPAPAAAAAGVLRYDPPFFTEARPNTAWDMIQRVPGFAFDGGANVRGFAGAAGNVLIDGDRPTTKEDNLQSVLQRIPASQVDHIDVIRGGAPGVDMQGRTVIANVVKKQGGGWHGVAAIADNAESDGRHAPSARLEISRKWAGQSFEASILPAAYIDDGDGDGVRVRTDANGNTLIRSNANTQGGGKQVTVTAAYERPLVGGKFKINGLAFYDRYTDNEDDHLYFPAPALELLHDNQEQAKGELGVHFERRLDKRTSVEALAIQQLRRKTYFSHFSATGDDEVFQEKDASGESIVRAIVRRQQSPKFSIEAAAEGAYNVQDSDSRFAYNHSAVLLPAAKVRVSETRGEGSTTATWRPSKKVTLEVAARAEASNIGSSGDVVLSKTLFFFKPRAVLTLSPDENNQLRLRVEREVGQLDFSDFVADSSLGAGTVRAGNPDLVPQNDWAFEAAIEHRWKSGADITLTARRLEIRDVVDRVPVFDASGGVFDAPGNLPRATENDIELNVSVPLDKALIKRGLLKASGTWRDSKVRDPLTGEERRISQQHPFDYQVHFTQDIPRWKSTWGVDVFNRWTESYYRYNEIDRYKLKTWVDVFVEYKPRSDLSLRVELDNLGARGFERVLNVYSGPRDRAPLAYVDDRRLEFGRIVYFRFRKSFG